MAKKEDLTALHENMITEFASIQGAVRDEREQCLEDRRFYSISGAQWEGELESQFENKPRLEVNKIHLSVLRIISEYRNNRIDVDFMSKTGNDELADTCDALFRADQHDSNADEAYDNAFEEAVGGGIGAFRIKTEYEDEEDDDNESQRIKIEPIFDADSSVFFDLGAKRQDKSDAKSCYVVTGMTYEAFESEFGEDVSSVQKQIERGEFDWTTDDTVYVAEVYQVKRVPHVVKIYVQNVSGAEQRVTQEELDEDPSIEIDLLDMGYTLDREKKTHKKKVRKYIISGNKILEDCGYIAGCHIPIVPVYGKRWYIDNTERCMGHVRLAKDAQRLKNMQLSKLAELSAAPSVEKPILFGEQVRGYEQTWADDNIKNYPYLPINAVKDENGKPIQTSPVGYTKPPSVPPAMAALLQVTEIDINDILGNQQQAEQIVSNISGEAVEKIQDRIDMQTFIYVSNFAKAMKRCGEIWLSMARELYIEDGRKMKGIGRDEKMSLITLNQPHQNESGTAYYRNDLTKANFDVVVEVGAKTSTKRKATVNSIKEMMMASGDQETINILSSLAIMNMEGEGVSDVRQYFRKKLVGQGVIEPTEEEAQEMAEAAANAQPSAQDQYLQAESQKSMAQAQKAQADTLYTNARADETVAKTMETIAKMDREDKDQFMKMMEMFKNEEGQPSSQEML
ncbi:MAG: portal protein [Candidatus Bathyarchaeota archaeon]|jgi:hypothetical protein